jgi:hypothetical protein
LKNISNTPDPGPIKLNGRPPKKKQFIVIEVPAKAAEHDYPKAVFACSTAEEALSLCKQMNADAGYERYGVQRPANAGKQDT